MQHFKKQSEVLTGQKSMKALRGTWWIGKLRDVLPKSLVIS